MSRQARISFPGAWYHIINRGILRSNIYYSSKHKKHFTKLMGEMVEKYKVEIHAYCLMDNHFHLIVHTPEANISPAIHFLESAYVNRINAEFEREGPFLKDRFLGIVIDSDAYLTHLTRYIHLNPKKAQIVDLPEYFKWSSYQAYLGHCQTPKWLTTSTVMAYFNDDTAELKNYTDDNETLDFENFYTQSEISPIMGGEEFRKIVMSKVIESNPNSQALKLPIFRDRYSLEQIHQVVTHNLAKHSQQLMKENYLHVNMERLLIIYIASKKSGQTNRQIANHFELGSRSSVSNSGKRLEKYIAKDESVRLLLNLCLSELITLHPINTDETIALIGG